MNYKLAQVLMEDFARSTGLTQGTPHRYLWTDAFAVCNFLGLFRHSGDEGFQKLAVQLVDQVHHTLGRHRSDDPRRGWISGLPEEVGQKHPTLGGLRIGKPLNERSASQAADSQSEWDRDGQYFHYLTKWMHALHRMAEATQVTSYRRWAAELAVTAHEAFTYEVSPGRPKRMVWKMSIDLRRVLVPSMGHHDPLDGLITFLELQSYKPQEVDPQTDLTPAIADLREMCKGKDWGTEDPLGIGGLLDATSRLAFLVAHRAAEDGALLHRVLADTEDSLNHFARFYPLNEPAERRLAFRELGLSIGMRSLEQLGPLIEQEPEIAPAVDRLLTYQPIAEQIEAFWSDPVRRRNPVWQEHGDINSVMLATSLAPGGYVQLS